MSEGGSALTFLTRTNVPCAHSAQLACSIDKEAEKADTTKRTSHGEILSSFASSRMLWPLCDANFASFWRGRWKSKGRFGPFVEWPRRECSRGPAQNFVQRRRTPSATFSTWDARSMWELVHVAARSFECSSRNRDFRGVIDKIPNV